VQQGMKKCCKRTVEHLKEKAAERLINEWENDEEVKTIEELEAENKRLRELLKEVISGNEFGWEWTDKRMDWVEVQIDKEVLLEAKQALKGGGE